MGVNTIARSDRVATRLVREILAAAEMKPPRDDLRKRYKERDIDREDKADYKDTHGDPDLKLATRAEPARRLDRRALEREIAALAVAGREALHRLNDDLYLAAVPKGTGVMVFHLERPSGEKIGLAAVGKKRWGNDTPAEAAESLCASLQKSNLRLFC